MLTAQSRIGEDHYCLLANNCEHFVTWCVDGDHSSFQVSVGVSALKTAVIGTCGVGAVTTISVCGAVAGLSGPGIMSGLATIGSLGGLVSGGAIAGLGMVAAAPAVASTLVLNYTVLKDSPALDEAERAARSAGRIGTGVGATAGTLGGLMAVWGLGSVAGFSGAGIASGLAAIGSATGAGTALTAVGVGGGMMIGGVVATVAAPALVAVAFGYAVYRGERWRRGLGPVQPRPIPLPVPPAVSVSFRVDLGGSDMA